VVINMAKEKRIEDFQVNDTYSFCRTFTEQNFAAFSEFSGDKNPLHHDASYASKTAFSEPIVPLHLAASPLSAIAGMIFPGHKSLYLSHQLKALSPVPYNVELTFSAKIIAIDLTNRILTIRTIIFHERQLFIEAEQKIQVRDDVDDIGEVEALCHSGAFIQPSQSILLTGAAGELGQSIAHRFAHLGYDLILQVRKKTAHVQQLIDDLKSQHAIEVDIMECDLAQCGVAEFESLLVNLNQKAVCVVHCASPALTSDITSLMAVNYAAMKSLTDALLPQWLEQQKGTLIFVSSSAMHFHPQGWQDYSAAKAAGVSFCSSFNHHFQSMGLSAKVISPGLISTNFSAQVEDHSNAMLPEQVAEAIVELYESDQSFYTWVEKNITRAGDYGFFAKQDTIQLLQPEKSQLADAVQNNQTDSLAATLQALIVKHLGLPQETDWSSAGVAITPKWDSLNHMLLLVEVERQFGVSVASFEMDRTTTYQQLLSMLTEKLSG